MSSKAYLKGQVRVAVESLNRSVVRKALSNIEACFGDDDEERGTVFEGGQDYAQSLYDLTDESCGLVEEHLSNLEDLFDEEEEFYWAHEGRRVTMEDVYAGRAK